MFRSDNFLGAVVLLIVLLTALETVEAQEKDLEFSEVVRRYLIDELTSPSNSPELFPTWAEKVAICQAIASNVNARVSSDKARNPECMCSIKSGSLDVMCSNVMKPESENEKKP